MKHYILGKFKPEIEDRSLLYRHIRQLFSTVSDIPGIHGVNVYENCIDRDNRYDVMIVLDMDCEAISNWDTSAIHHRWKEKFGKLLERKAIFDHE